MGNTLGKASNKGKQEGVQWETRGDKTVGKANTPSNKGSQEGVQWEAQGDKTLRKADAPSNKGKQEGVQWAMGDKGKQERRGTMGDKWRQGAGKADTPTNKRKQQRVQWETKGDKTLGKAGKPFNTKAATLRKH